MDRPNPLPPTQTDLLAHFRQRELTPEQRRELNKLHLPEFRRQRYWQCVMQNLGLWKAGPPLRMPRFRPNLTPMQRLERLLAFGGKREVIYDWCEPYFLASAIFVADRGPGKETASPSF